MVAGLFLTYDNSPESENYWSQKYSGKNEKMLSFFLFSYKMITTTYYLCRKRNSCEGNNRRIKELFFKIPCFEKKLKLRNDNAFFCISKDSFEIHFFS